MIINIDRYCLAAYIGAAEGLELDLRVFARSQFRAGHEINDIPVGRVGSAFIRVYREGINAYLHHARVVDIGQLFRKTHFHIDHIQEQVAEADRDRREVARINLMRLDGYIGIGRLAIVV